MIGIAPYLIRRVNSSTMPAFALRAVYTDHCPALGLD
jgi:hypothetical protein